MDVATQWLKTGGVALLCLGGGLLAYRIGSHGWRAAILVYLAGLLGVALAILPRYFPTLQVAGFAWIIEGRREFALLGVGASMLFGALLPRLPLRRQKILAAGLAAIALVHIAVLPFLGPLLIRNQLAGIETELDAHGVCRQTSWYTCGPAAAVTALRQLGVPAEEGDLAIRAGTGPTTGTPADMLCRGILAAYRGAGIRCQYRTFDRIEDLRGPGMTVARMKLTFFADHYVAVLRVEDDHVVVGDPLTGKRRLPHEDFAQRWRWSGLRIDRNSR